MRSDKLPIATAGARPQVGAAITEGAAQLTDRGEQPLASKATTLTHRLLLLATLGALPVLGLAGALLQWLFIDHIQRQFDSYLNAYQQELIAQLTLDDSGHLRPVAQPLDPRFNLPFSGWYWQVISGDRIIAQSRSIDPAGNAGANNGAHPLLDDDRLSWSGDTIGPGGIPVRLISAGIRLPGNVPMLQVIVSGPQSEISAQSSSFGVHLTLILVTLGLAFLVATLLQVRFGLSPLRRLQSELQYIRSGIAARLSAGYPAEVAPLAEELNAVLDHNRALIDRARTQAGNLAHALKTPLSVLRHEAGRISTASGALLQSEILQEQLDAMERQVERTLARIRLVGPDKAGGSRCDIGGILQDLVFSMELLHRDRGLRLELIMPAPLVFLGDDEDLTEILGNLIDNACKWARGHVRVSAHARASGGAQKIRLLIEDDGPGIPAVQRSLVLQRGLRLDETKPGTGLGLDIVCETAELYGGTLQLGESSLGGLSAELILPGSPL